MGWDYNRSMFEKNKLRQKQLSLIDNRPNKVRVAAVLNSKKLRVDVERANDIRRENTKMVQRILSAPTYVEAFNPRKDARFSKTHLKHSYMKLREIEHENYKLGCRLLKAKSSAEIRSTLVNIERFNSKKKEIIPNVHNDIITKYRSFIWPYDETLLKKLLRPNIFFDLYMQNVRPIGRIVIELFTEACPEIVLQFVRMCTYNSFEQISFLRTFPHLWFEAEIKSNNDILSKPGYMHQKYCINHGVGPGVLSFAKCFLDGFPPGFINFTISFKPLKVLNGYRVPFGLVKKGLRFLDVIKEIGSKNGVMKKNIIVTKCGYI
ncbi:uncharacterized protein LOC119676995 [Teleopsis dalmanni]|uniref:uncharacterized protein LOC119676995 n=1 Tax=Teleopsis dalmanni TaxID=139649 RepID=UPI0018CC7F23|nr:uncharacterized protein LOC119676995 [Teleopsis dalmanni]